MKNNDTIFGTTHVPEYFCEIKSIPLTRREKLIIIWKSFKRESLFAILHVLGLALKIGFLAYLGGMFFKMGMN